MGGFAAGGQGWRISAGDEANTQLKRLAASSPLDVGVHDAPLDT